MNLKPFVLTAELASFTAAARELGVSPAAVSKAVRRLEDELGVRLLERTSRSVHLTEEGQVWLEHARQALDTLHRGQLALAQRRDAVAGTIRVSVSPVLADPTLRALAPLLAREPALNLEVQVTDQRVRLAADAADLAIRVGPLGASDLLARRIATLRWIQVASPALPPVHTFADLTAARCLAFRGPDGRQVPWVMPAGQTVQCAVALTDGNALVAAARAGLGVAQVFQSVAQPFLASNELVQVLPEWCPPGPEVYVLFSTTKRRIPRVRAAIEALATGFAA